MGIVEDFYEPHMVPKPLIPVSDTAGTVVAVGESVAKRESVQLSTVREQLARSAGFADYHELRQVALRTPDEGRLLRSVFSVSSRELRSSTSCRHRADEVFGSKPA